MKGIPLTFCQIDESILKSDPTQLFSPNKFKEIIDFIANATPCEHTLSVIRTAIRFFGLPVAYHCQKLYKKLTLIQKKEFSKVLRQIETEVTLRCGELCYNVNLLKFFHIQENLSTQESMYSIYSKGDVCCITQFTPWDIFAMSPSTKLQYMQTFVDAPLQFARLICSFLNGQGGTIIIGMRKVTLLDSSEGWIVNPISYTEELNFHTIRFGIYKAIHLISSPELVSQYVVVEPVQVSIHAYQNLAKRSLKLYVIRIHIKNNTSFRVYTVSGQPYVRGNDHTVKMSKKDFYKYRVRQIQQLKAKKGPEKIIYHHSKAQQNERLIKKNSAFLQISPLQKVQTEPMPQNNNSLILQRIHQLLRSASDKATPDLNQIHEQVVEERNRHNRRSVFFLHRNEAMRDEHKQQTIDQK